MAHITAQCHSVLERIIILGQIKYQILFVRSKLNKSSIRIFVSTLQCSALVSLLVIRSKILYAYLLLFKKE